MNATNMDKIKAVAWIPIQLLVDNKLTHRAGITWYRTKTRVRDEFHGNMAHYASKREKEGVK